MSPTHGPCAPQAGGNLEPCAPWFRRRLLPALSLLHNTACFIQAVVVVAGLGAGYLLLDYLAPRSAADPASPQTLDLAVSQSDPESPLPVGTMSPPFEAAGWVNGPPPQPGSHGAGLIVLDIWSHW
jgi:hypothetical protein